MDVVIIGGGLAGLSCALSLLDENPSLKVAVLEARDRVGGRTFSRSDPEHGRADMGGAYIGTTQDRVQELLKRFNLNLYDVYRDGESIAVNGPNSQPLRYNGLIPPYSTPALLDLNTLLVEMDDLANSVVVEAPWTTPGAAELDKQTVGQWIASRGWTHEATQAARGAVQSLVCSDPDEVSLLWWLWLVRSGSNLKMLMAIKDGGQEKKVVEGLAALSERLAAHLGCVQLASPVARVFWSAAGARVVTRDGRELRCSHLVVALAPSLYNTIEWSPPLPPEKAQLGQRMPMGSIIKTVTYYAKPFWRLLGLSGEAFDASGAPVVYSVDDTKPDGSHPAIMGFVSAHAARKMQLLSLEDRKAVVAAHYRRIYGFDEPPVGYVEKNWSANPFSGGCYMSVCGPGVVTGFFLHIREPLPGGRVHFAGTETAVRWSGYADGAVESGQRCAAEVLGKRFDWNARPAPSLMHNEPLKFSSLERKLPKYSTILAAAAAISVAAISALVFAFL